MGEASQDIQLASQDMGEGSQDIQLAFQDMGEGSQDIQLAFQDISPTSSDEDERDGADQVTGHVPPRVAVFIVGLISAASMQIPVERIDDMIDDVEPNHTIADAGIDRDGRPSVYSPVMLVIRNEQFDAFHREEWRSFLRTIAAEARAILVAQGHPGDLEPLEGAVEDAVELAQRYGFRARPHLLRFACFVVVKGPGWETPAARAALEDDTLTAEAKLDRIEAG